MAPDRNENWVCFKCGGHFNNMAAFMLHFASCTGPMKWRVFYSSDTVPPDSTLRPQGFEELGVHP
jgi:hypothetical protein